MLVIVSEDVEVMGVSIVSSGWIRGGAAGAIDVGSYNQVFEYWLTKG